MKNRYIDKGFTLIEAMIALVVLSLGLLALGQFQGQLLKSAGETKSRSEGVIIAQQKIEELRNITTLSQLIQGDPLNGYSSGTLLLSDSELGVVGKNATYDTVWTIDKQPTTADSALSVRIKVDTSWKDVSNTLQNEVLYSYVAWDDLEISAIEGDGSSSTENTGNLIPNPAGSGKIVDQSILDSDGDGAVDANWTPDTTDLPSGVTIYTKDGEKVVDVGGQQVLHIIGKDIINIKGSVLLGAGSPQSMGFNVVRAITSDAGICPYEDITVNPANYNCFVASDWFGNVGVLGEERANGNTLLCSSRISYNTNCTVLQAINNSTTPAGGNFNNSISLSAVTQEANLIDYCTYIGNPTTNGIIGSLPDQNFELNAGGCVVLSTTQTSLWVKVSLPTNNHTIPVGGVVVNGQPCTYTGGNVKAYSCTVDSNLISNIILITTVNKTAGNTTTNVTASCNGLSATFENPLPVTSEDNPYTMTVSGC